MTTCPDRRTDPEGSAWMRSACVRCGQPTGRKLDGHFDCSGSHRWQRPYVEDAHWSAVAALRKAGLA